MTRKLISPEIIDRMRNRLERSAIKICTDGVSGVFGSNASHKVDIKEMMAKFEPIRPQVESVAVRVPVILALDEANIPMTSPYLESFVKNPILVIEAGRSMMHPDIVKSRQAINDLNIPILEDKRQHMNLQNTDLFKMNNRLNSTNVVHIDNCDEAPPKAEEYGEMQQLRDPKVNSLKMLQKNLIKTTQKSRKNNKAAKRSRRINRS